MKTLDDRNALVRASARPLLLTLLLIGLAFAIGGCADSYGPAPVYRGAYATGYPAYGPGYGPGYGYPGYGYPGSVSIEVGDRPYYTRGPGYYVGRSYYVWKPGHWANRHGQRVWIHGHYVVRG